MEIPTSENFALTFTTGKEEETTGEYISAMLVSFAKLHVDKALKEASESAKPIKIYTNRWLTGRDAVDKDSILKSYPLTNIK